MMKPAIYKLLERCVEEGVSYGVARAHKHTAEPSREQIRDEVQRAVMNEICEWFEFPEVKEE